MSAIEAYRVATVMSLDITQTLGALRQMLEAQQKIVAGGQDIAKTFKGINEAAASTNFNTMAAGLERSAAAARATRDALKEAAGYAGAASGGAYSTPPSSAPPQLAPLPAPAAQIALPPAVMLPPALPAPVAQPMPDAPAMLALPPPARDFQRVGDAYGPGTSLVPTGIGRTNTEATGARPASPNEGALTAYNPAGALAGRGGVLGENGPAPVNLFGPPPSPIERGRFPSADAYMAGYVMQGVGAASSDFISSAFEAGAKVNAELKMLGGMRGSTAGDDFNPDRVKEAYAEAVKLQQSVLGTYVGGNVALLIKIMGITQSATASMQMLPEMARAQQVFAGYGRNGPQEIQAALNAGELRGVLFHKDKQGKEVADTVAIDHFLKNMEALTAMTGGRYGPAEMLQFLKSAGISGAIMSDEHGFAEVMAFIQSMGAARAGTALRAFGREFPGGKMSDASFNRLTEMGIIKHPELAYKVGIGYWQLKPGAISQGDFHMSGEQSAAFISNVLLPRVQAFDAKEYKSAYTQAGDTRKLEIETVTMGQIASMIPGGQYMSETLRLAPLIGRDVSAFDRSRDQDAYQTAVVDNPLMQLQGYKASLDAIMTTLGKDNMQAAVDALKSLTSGLNALNDTLTAHQWMGRSLMLVASGLSAIGVSLGVLLPSIATYAGLVRLKQFGFPGSPLPAVPPTPKGGGGIPFIGWNLPLLGGALTKMAADYFDPNNAVDAWADRNIPGFGWLDFKLNKAFNGTGNDAADRASFNQARGINPNTTNHTTVNLRVQIDGKDIPGRVFSDVIRQAAGPETSTGSFDLGAMYSPPQH